MKFISKVGKERGENKMGQTECLKALKNERWLSTTEIAKKLNQKGSMVTVSLRRLHKQGLILRIRNDNSNPFLWKLK